MPDRDALAIEVQAIVAKPNATPAWKAEQILAWLDRHRVVLCNHDAPAWACHTDCPAFQAAYSRAVGAERRLQRETPYQHGYDDGWAAAWAAIDDDDDPDQEDPR